MKPITALCCLAAAVVLTGCYEETNIYYVNPDGSGKVVHEVVAVAENLDLTGGTSDPDPQSLLNKTARKILQESRGIDVWSDIETRVTDDGKLYFKGTGYFPNIRNVSFVGKDDPDINTHLEITLTPDGLLTLAMREDAGEKETSDPVDFTPEQLQQKLQQQRIKYTQMKPVMIQLLDSLKKQDTFHYAGTLIQSVNFQTAENSVTVALEGRKLLAYMDALMADDAAMLELIRQGKNMEEGFNNPDMYAFFWGQPELPIAEIQLTRPVFDYAQEVAAAKSEYDNMITELDLTASSQFTVASAQAPSPGAELHNLRIAGVSYYYDNHTLDNFSFGKSPGCELSVVSQLPQVGLQVKDGTLTKATTLGGQSVLPKHAHNRSLSPINVADDGLSVSFDIELELPAENETGFEEIAGTIICFKSGSEKIVDLGVMELKEGSRNEAENISIGSAGVFWSNQSKVEFKINMPEHVFKDIRLFTEDGRQIETRLYSSGTSNGMLIHQGISTEEPLPEKARVEFILYDNIQEYEIPFSLKNISLLGKPLNQQ
jgi:hypothetical protein